MQERHQLTDNQQDVLSHKQRRDAIHILTLDPGLARDIVARIHGDSRLKPVKLVKPPRAPLRLTIDHIEKTAPDTVSSRLLIFDVRKFTLPKLHHCYNKADCRAIPPSPGPVAGLALKRWHQIGLREATPLPPVL